MAPAGRIRPRTSIQILRRVGSLSNPLPSGEGIEVEAVESPVSPPSNEEGTPHEGGGSPPSERLRGPKQATAVPQAARPNSRPELLVSIRAPIPTDLVGAYTEAQRTISELEAKIEHLESVNANRRFMDHKLDETTRKNADYQRQIAYLTELRNREENIPSRASEAPAGYQYAGELRAAFTRNLDAIKGESEQAVKRCMTQVRLVEDENIKLRAELGKRLNLEADVRRYAMRHHREIVGHLRKRESLEQALEEKEIKISGLEARLERQRSEIRELIAEQG